MAPETRAGDARAARRLIGPDSCRTSASRRSSALFNKMKRDMPERQRRVVDDQEYLDLLHSCCSEISFLPAGPS